jgi:RecB family exonuclease
MVKQKKFSGGSKEVSTKGDLKKFKEEIVHVISEGLIDQIKLLAEGHSGIIDRLSGMDVRLDRMEKENERQHLETRALVKISFSELDRRVSNLESQVKDLQEWKKEVQSRL